MDQSNALLLETQSEDSGGAEGVTENPSSVWGRLVPLNTCSLLTLEGAEVIVGRAMVSADDVTVSKEHFKLKLGSDGVVMLENLSQHGTYVEDKLITAGDVILKKNDSIKLGAKPNSPSYIFVPCETLDLGRVTTDTGPAQGNPQAQTAAGTSTAADEGGEAKEVPQKRKASLDALEEELRCGLCGDLFCDAITLSCGHNYCNACFSDWYRMKTEREHTVCSCPECRRPVRSASRCHRLTRMVETYLKTHAELQRSPRTAADMVKRSIVTGEPMMIGKRSGEDGSEDGYTDDEDSDAGRSDSDGGGGVGMGAGTRCRQCPPRGGRQAAGPAAGEGFQCGEGGAHLRCSACLLLLPNRDPAPTAVRCSGCQRVFCDAYWRSQAAPTDPNHRPPPLCRSGVSLLKLTQHALTGLPRGAHAGNPVEQEITTRALLEAGICLADAVGQSIAKVESGEWGGELHRVWPNVGTNMVVAPADLQSMFCTSCATAVNSQLFDRYRMAMKPEDLPPDARCRENCWYGLGCRTQHHKPDHARRLNHVCVAKRSGGPSGHS